jgi:hypothetical protein
MIECEVCGVEASAAETRLSWVVSFERDTAGAGPSYYCPGCARANLRSIESKLERAYW